MPAKKNLVIVESPAKAKTIEKYLGNKYTVKASMGHLRDLPKSSLGVDLETFEPKYISMRDKTQVIKELKTEAKKADTVFLATDPDREGEAISWHLKELLALPDEKAKRVTFNEITKNVVTKSIQNPREIDQNLVNAQQARRVLDRIVGYQLSPMLWHTVKYGLSAGRVQSVAVRMVVDRENEIRAFQKEEYWHLDAVLSPVSPENGKSFTARYFAPEGVEKKQTLRTKEETDAIIEKISQAPFSVKKVTRSQKPRKPSAPFRTSTLQQEASRRLNMTPRRTMMIAQQLYEGVEISGRGSIGLITYMRTDSLRISEEAIAAARNYVSGIYGDSFVPKSARHFQTGAGAQDAHEAIRPSDVSISPEEIRGDLTREQYMLYRLIWRRFVASQMADAIYDEVTADMLSAGYIFQAQSSEVRFKGFTVLYEEAKDEESDELSGKLPYLEEGQGLTFVKAIADQQFTQPPRRYTEATLIQDMEKKGIGRPSTYAATVATISSHGYVSKEGKYLQPTPLGEVVTGFLEDHFSDIVDVKFTSNMETNLDQIENGSEEWKSVLRRFYDDFSKEIAVAEKATDGVRLKVPDVETDEICDVCGAKMVKKRGRFGDFLGCSNFPTCNFTKPIVIEMPGKCPKCGGRILKRTSKNNNVYYACEENKPLCSFRAEQMPEEETCPRCGSKVIPQTDDDGKVTYVCERNLQRRCDFITWDVPTKDFCPSCGKTLFKRSGRGQARTFCENEACEKFVPLEERGYRKKQTKEEISADTKETSAKTAAKTRKSAKTTKSSGTAASAGTRARKPK